MALPLSLRSAIQQTTRENKPLASAASMLQTAVGHRPNARDQVRQLYHLSLRYQVDSAFYWKASHLTPFDSGYDPRSRAVKELIYEVSTHGFENGVHPGYYTFENVAELGHEINKLREAIGVSDLGGRQHYLRWSTKTWSDWEQPMTVRSDTPMPAAFAPAPVFPTNRGWSGKTAKLVC
jgi:hypothetical protein